jgi:hypothetical protein
MSELKEQLVDLKIIKVFLNRGTMPRLTILAILLGLGYVTWFLLHYHPPQFQWYKDLIGDIKQFTWLVGTLPIVIGLWIFRNNDKRKDHENAKIAQEQLLTSYKKEETTNTIALLDRAIDQIIESKIKLKDVEYAVRDPLAFSDDTSNEVIGFGYYLLNFCDIHGEISQGIKGKIKVHETNSYKELHSNLKLLAQMLENLSVITKTNGPVHSYLYYRLKYLEYAKFFNIQDFFKYQ